MIFEIWEGFILNQEKLEGFEKAGLLDLIGSKAREIIEQDCDTVSACMARPYPLVVDRAKGSIIGDIDGREYIDFVAGIAVMNAGYSNPEVKAAISAQLEKITHIGYGDFLPNRLQNLQES